MNTKTLPPMTRKEWQALPDVVKYFHPWKRAKRALAIKARKPKGRKHEQQK
jgi:hypothetical protein